MWAKEEEDEEVADGPDSVEISWSLVSRGQRLYFVCELHLRKGETCTQLPGEGPGEETVVSLFSGRHDASQCCKK